MINRRPLRWLFLILCLLLPRLATAELSLKEMLYIVYRIESPELAPTHFGAQPRSLWRVGTRYLRMEEPHNPETGLHLLFISRAPDTWMIDLRSRRTKHVIDPGPGIDVHVLIIASMPPGKLKKLEFGNELSFFRRHGASVRPVPDQPSMSEWLLSLDGFKLALQVQSGNRPRYLRVEQPDKRTYTIVYVQYERQPHIDWQRFELPAGLIIEKARPTPLTSPGNDI